MPVYQTIEVRCREGYRVRDLISTEAITPGHVVEPAANGTVRRNTIVTAGLTSRLVALHDKYIGKEIVDAWAVGARVQFGIFLPGDEVQLVLKGLEVATVEGLLRVDGVGRVVVLGLDAPFARSMEARTAGAADTHVWARLL